MRNIALIYGVLFLSYRYNRNKDECSGRLEPLTDNYLYSPLQYTCVLSSVYPFAWSVFREKTSAALRGANDDEHSADSHFCAVGIHPMVAVRQKIWFDDDSQDGDWNWQQSHVSFFGKSQLHQLNVDSENMALNANCQMGHALTEELRQSVADWCQTSDPLLLDSTPLKREGQQHTTTTAAQQKQKQSAEKTKVREYVENVRMVFANHLQCDLKLQSPFKNISADALERYRANAEDKKETKRVAVVSSDKWLLSEVSHLADSGLKYGVVNGRHVVSVKCDGGLQLVLSMPQTGHRECAQINGSQSHSERVQASVRQAIHPLDLLALFEGGTGSIEHRQMRQALLLQKQKRQLKSRSKTETEREIMAMAGDSGDNSDSRRQQRQDEIIDHLLAKGTKPVLEAIGSHLRVAIPLLSLHLSGEMNDHCLVATGIDKLFLPLSYNHLCLSKAATHSTLELDSEHLAVDLCNVSYFDTSTRIWAAFRWKYSTRNWSKNADWSDFLPSFVWKKPENSIDFLQNANEKVLVFDRPFDIYLFDPLRNVVYAAGTVVKP